MLKTQIKPNCNHLTSDYMWGAILTVPVSVQNMCYSLSDDYLTVGTHVPLIQGLGKAPCWEKQENFS